MKPRRKNRLFPYYIITGVFEKEQEMLITDLNTIQKRVWENDKEVIYYEEDSTKHNTKRIMVPGATKAIRDRTILWMKSMMGETFMAEKKCMVYNHRAHWTNPIHEEYKRKVFLEWEAAQVSKPEVEEDPEEIKDEDLEID
jgi:hypothetical protein